MTPDPEVESDTFEQFQAYRASGDRALRNAIVEQHMKLADYLAARFAHRGEPIEDLRQVALVALVKAVERFDPDRGLQFSTFATPTILGELKRHFRDRGWAVRVPRRVQELHLALSGIAATLGQELGRVPTPQEIAERAGASEEEVLEAMEASSLYRLASIDAERPNDDPQRAGLAARLGELDEDLGSVDDRALVTQLLEQLPARQQQILYLRFFRGLTQSEIAERIGISQMHVSRLLAKSLAELGTQVGADVDPG